MFDPEAAEAVIVVTLEEHGNAAGITELVAELRWAIAQLRAERAERTGELDRLRRIESASRIVIDERTRSPDDECHRAANDHLASALDRAEYARSKAGTP